MKILVTGAKGFVGQNLVAQLKNIKEGKARWYGLIDPIEEIFEYDIKSDPEDLDRFCKEADFVFNLAGVNRPKDDKEFMEGNFGFASTLLNTLKKHGNTCPVMLSSSVQASLSGRFGNSEYGRSKKAGEELFINYGYETGARVLIYRFPNLFGKWCRPNYNSAVATFCNNIAKDLPITVNDPNVELELLYIDDLVDELIKQLAEWQWETGNVKLYTVGKKKPEPEEIEGVDKDKAQFYRQAKPTFKVTLGEIVELLHTFHEMPRTLMVPQMPPDSFAKRLMATYLSYLPREKAIFDLNMNKDDRGSFTELIKTLNSGQVSVNVSKPGVTKGQHWHNTKWEQFIVVSGQAKIQMRKEANPKTPFPSWNDVWEFEVSGERLQSVIMLPGYTHNIINLSETEPLVTIMYCNEPFDPERPDTYYDPV